MNWIDRLRQWCAKPFIEAEVARCAVLVDQHSSQVTAQLIEYQRQVWEQAFAEGQRAEHARLMEELEEYLFERGRISSLSETEMIRLRNKLRQ